MTKRGAMTPARKRRIHARENGVCWVCGAPVEMTGPSVRYDHRGTLWITESDEDADIFPIHLDPCDRNKTYGEDIPRIAKTKRQMTMRLDVPRKEPRRKIHSQGFQPGQHALRSRSTFATRKRPQP